VLAEEPDNIKSRQGLSESITYFIADFSSTLYNATIQSCFAVNSGTCL